MCVVSAAYVAAAANIRASNCIKALQPVLRIPAPGEHYPDPKIEVDVEPPEVKRKSNMRMLQDAVLNGALASQNSTIGRTASTSLGGEPDAGRRRHRGAWSELEVGRRGWRGGPARQGHQAGATNTLRARIQSAQVSDTWFEVEWDSGNINSYRFGAGVYDVVALREVYNGLFGQQIPRIDWLTAGYPLPEHVRAPRA